MTAGLDYANTEVLMRENGPFHTMENQRHTAFSLCPWL
jgi:hypothetical protein